VVGSRRFPVEGVAEMPPGTVLGNLGKTDVCDRSRHSGTETRYSCLHTFGAAGPDPTRLVGMAGSDFYKSSRVALQE
jgi:hypothetical protein